MSGPAWMRPEAHRDAARPEEAAKVQRARRVRRARAECRPARPPTFIPATSATTVRRNSHDRPAHEQPASAYPRTIPLRLRRSEHEALREPALEVAGDPEPGEDAAERGRLQQHEHELERRVAGLVVESRAPLRPATGRLRKRRRRTSGTPSSAGGSAGSSVRSSTSAEETPDMTFTGVMSASCDSGRAHATRARAR